MKALASAILHARSFLEGASAEPSAALTKGVFPVAMVSSLARLLPVWLGTSQKRAGITFTALPHYAWLPVAHALSVQ